MLKRILLTLLLALPMAQADAADLWRQKGAPSFVDSNGKPYRSGKLCYYEAGTTDALTVYKDAEQENEWQQPITLNSGGALSDPIFVPKGAFKEVFLSSDATDCDSGTTLFSSDDIPGALDASDLGISFARTEMPVLSRTGSVTIDLDELGYLINVDTTGGAATVNLPSVLDVGDGAVIAIRKADSASNDVTITPDGSETVNGASTYVLSRQYDSVTLVSDGAQWNAVDAIAPGVITFSKLAASAYDTDGTLAADSETRLPTQSAVKEYVDASVASGIKWKEPVRLATTANGTLVSDFENGDEIDGEALATGDRILIKNQSDGEDNGIYVVASSGAPTRATDADDNGELPGATVFVEEGDENASTQWTQTVTPTTVGTTELVFTKIAGGTVYSADGSTLQLSGSTFSIKSGGVGETQIANLAVTSGKIASAAVGVSQLSTIAAGRLMQVGTVFDYVGTSCPSYSLEAYGQAVSRSTYSALFAVASTTFGVGDGSTTFNLPDLRGRVVAGEDDMGGSSANRLTNITDSLNGDTLGATGGVEGAAVAQTNLSSFTLPFSLATPAHGHTATTTLSSGNLILRNPSVQNNITANGSIDGLWRGGGTVTITASTTVADANSMTIFGTVSSGGSSTALSKVQPTMALKKCIHTGV